jgi:hypothetical protein
MNKYKVNTAFISIAVDYFQVISILLDSKIVWPQSVVQLMQILSAFNLNLNIVAPECLVPNVTFIQKFYFIQAIPIGLFSILTLVNVTYIGYKYLILGRARKDLMKHASTLKSVGIVIIYFLYLYLTRTILSVFDCTTTIPPSYDSNGNTVKYLSVVFEQCGKPGGIQLTLIPLAIISLIVYTLGFPIFLANRLYIHRENIMLDQLLRAKNSGNSRFTNPTAYDVRKSYSRLYYQFKPDFFWWSIIIISRKFFIAITAVMFSSNVAFQMASCLLILFISYVLQTKFNPFMSYTDYEQVLKDNENAGAWSTLHSKLNIIIRSIEMQGRRKFYKNTIITKNGSINRSALLLAAGAWMFNYNTVEAIMLFCGVIVSLLGLMYQSQSELYDKSSRDAISGLVIFVISSSIIYLAAVFGVEIYISIAPKYNNTAVLSSRNIQQKTLEMISINTNDSTETNPLMLTQDITKTLDIDKFVEPPGKEIWGVVQSLIKQQNATIASQTELIAGLKKQTQKDAIVLTTFDNEKNNALSLYKKEYKSASTKTLASGQKDQLNIPSST